MFTRSIFFIKTQGQRYTFLTSIVQKVPGQTNDMNGRRCIFSWFLFRLLVVRVSCMAPYQVKSLLPFYLFFFSDRDVLLGPSTSTGSMLAEFVFG